MAMQAPFGRPMILTICPSNIFHCNFNAQHILPILSKFLLQKFIKFQPRGGLILERH